MDDLINKEQAIDKIKKRLFETAFNNVGIKQNIDETLVDVAENRLENWLDELPSIQPEQRWIPVSERLPADNTIVQVTFANGKVGQSSWHKENEYNNGFDAVMHGITDRNFVTFGVIAWKPLPEPYQGGD